LPSSCAASRRPWPAIKVPFSRTNSGMVKPNRFSEAFSASICFFGCSRALNAYGLTRPIDQLSIAALSHNAG
jgi:hypothetical protein